jgi:hypothetical protein
MKCPHCSINFHDDWVETRFLRHNQAFADCDGSWLYRTVVCAGCKKAVIEIGQPIDAMGNKIFAQVYPAGSSRGPVPMEVPKPIADDYIEACNVLAISTKASAALSRRCLQHMLRDHDYRAKDLANEIDLLLKEADPLRALPRRLRDTIDVIRNFGNFAAHPNEIKASLEIIDIEPQEAEWCLETIEELFEHFYVGPAIAAAKKAALNAKLASMGKPPAK